jgi:hypothetical protein
MPYRQIVWKLRGAIHHAIGHEAEHELDSLMGPAGLSTHLASRDDVSQPPACSCCLVTGGLGQAAEGETQDTP